MKRRLTSLVLTSLKPTAKPYYVADEQQTGLRVRVAPTGALSWSMVYRIKGAGGAPKGVSLGVCDPTGKNGLGLAEARDRAAEILKAARQSRDLIKDEQGSRDFDKARRTVSELIDLYAHSIKSVNRKGGVLRSADDIERRLRRALASKMSIPADDLARGDISGILDAVAEKHPREAEKRRQVIGAMYRWGVAKGYAERDPTHGSESYGQGTPRDRVLAPDEIRLVWAWLEAGADAMPEDYIEVLKLQFCLGSRIGEVAGMDASEITMDGDQMVWTLPAARAKNKKERATPLIGWAREIVEAALQCSPSGLLFQTQSTGKPLTSSHLGNALNNRNLPCAPFSTHDIRRTVVSEMDDLGIPLDTIAAVVGHRRGSRDTRTLVRHYSRARLDTRIAAALATWDRRLRAIVEVRSEGAHVIDLHPKIG